MDDRGSIPCKSGEGILSLHHRVQTVSGVDAASYATGSGGYFPKNKAAGA
jgi:hypothetical protein